jgi:hypothetical protein
MHVGSTTGRRLRSTWLWVAVAGLAACSGTEPSHFGDGDSGGSGDGGGREDSTLPMHDSGIPNLGHDSASGDGPSDAPADAASECPASATLVYVTGTDNHLWSFYPTALIYPDAGVGPAFVDIGPLTCLSGPTHMTVDRQGFAWVVAGGKIFKASTKDATCSAVTTWTPHPFTFSDFALTSTWPPGR